MDDAAESFPCERCGAPAVFSPELQQLSCEHCGHAAPIDAPRGHHARERDFEAARAQLRREHPNGWVHRGYPVACDSCGARFVLPGPAGRCAYCDWPITVDVRELAELLPPESLLPFAIPRETADAVLKAWLGGLWFAPNAVRKRIRSEPLQGIYVPYYTFDTTAVGSYSGERGTHYWTTESYTDSDGKHKTRRVRHTSWSPTAGCVTRDFDDLIVCASFWLPRDVMHALEPWDLEQLVPFTPEFLSGFLSESVTMDLEDAFEVTHERIEAKLRGDAKRAIGGDEQRVHSIDVDHENVSFKHLLLPVWMSSMRHRDKVYRIAVNARTGEVSGEYPYSWVKITLAALAACALAAFVYYQRTGF